MTQLKVNYIVFAATVACITAHSWRQLNNSNVNKLSPKTSTAEVHRSDKQAVTPVAK